MDGLTKDWWQSKTVWGGIVSSVAAPALLLLFHYTLPMDLADELAMLLAAVGGIVAIIGRMRATTVIQAPPVKEAAK